MLVRSFSTSSAVPKPLITILLPALAKTRANARPIPVVEPVMTAVLPRRSGIFVPCVAFSHQIRSDDRSNAMDRCEHSTNSLAFVDPDQADRDALLKVSPATEIRAIAFLIRPSCGWREPVKKNRVLFFERRATTLGGAIDAPVTSNGQTRLASRLRNCPG